MLIFTLTLLGVYSYGEKEVVQLADDNQKRLPGRITNNSVALVVLYGEPVIYSFLGLGPGKTYRDTKLSAFEYHLMSKKGRVLPPSPGLHGRLAGVAATVDWQIVIFGGYSVAAAGTEFSDRFVHAFVPLTAA